MKVIAQHRCADRWSITYKDGDMFYQFWSPNNIDYMLVYSKYHSITMCQRCNEFYSQASDDKGKYYTKTPMFKGNWDFILENHEAVIMRELLR